jgi:hypothetical protein
MGLFGKREPKFPALVPIPAIAELPPARMQASVRYLGTFDQGGEKVIGAGLAAKSSARLSLSNEALDVVRIAGSFRIRVDTLRGASSGERFAGKAVRDLLLVRWAHGDHQWETGFRMEASKTVKDGTVEPRVGDWVRTISKLARINDGGNA